MKKNLEFENWIADQMAAGLIIMEPYGYREEEEGKYLHIFKLMLQFEDTSEPFKGVAFISIPYPECIRSVDD